MENTNELADAIKESVKKIDEAKAQATPEKGEQAEAKPQVEQKPVEGQEPTDEPEDKPLDEMLGEEELVDEPEESDDDFEEDEDDVEMIPKATMLEVKRKLKEKIRALESKTKAPAQAKDLREIADSIAEKYPDVSNEFIQDLLGPVAGMFEQIQKEKKQSELSKKKDELFDKVYGQIAEKNPAINEIVNKDFIKQESMKPENKGKTVKEIIKTVYGNALEKKIGSFDSYVPTRGTPEPTNLSNPSLQEMKDINADPKLKEKFIQNVIDKTRW